MSRWSWVPLCVLTSVTGTSVPTIDCYLGARDEELMGYEAAVRLCRGASSLAPLDCFQAITDATILTEGQAVELCKCARTVAPAECFVQGRDRTFLDDATLLMLCAPTYSEELDAACLPVARVVPW